MSDDGFVSAVAPAVARVKFLRALQYFMGERCLSSLRICELFNPKDKSDERGELRLCWMDLNVGVANVNVMEDVLKSCVGTVIRVAGVPYTVGKVKRRGSEERWAFGYGTEVGGREAFLRALRKRMGAGVEWKAVAIAELIGGEAELEELAMSVNRRIDPLSLMQVTYLLRDSLYLNVDGWVLVRRSTAAWRFVKR